MKVKFRYVGGGEFYHGIPARDLTKGDWERLTAEQQALVVGSPLYAPPDPPKSKSKAKAKTEGDPDLAIRAEPNE